MISEVLVGYCPGSVVHIETDWHSPELDGRWSSGCQCQDFFPTLGGYCLGPPQYGHLSAVDGIRVPQYLQFTLATSLITTCSGGFAPMSVLDSHGVSDGAGGGE